MNPKNGDAEVQLSDVQTAARALKQRIEIINASSAPEIDIGFASLTERKIGGLMVAADPFFNNRRDQIISLASQYAICRRPLRHGGQCIDAAFVAELMVVEVAAADRVEIVVTTTRPTYAMGDFRCSFR